MKRRTTIALLLLAAVMLAACGGGQTAGSPPQQEEIVESSLNVQKIENLPEDFILGMDVSSVIALEDSGVRFYDYDGQEKDLFLILAANGVTHIRVRVWNDPYDAAGNGYGGGNCDIDKAVQIGKRATAAGLRLIVDFHYSDFWADPSKQRAPKAWEGMDAAAKADAVYAYTKESLEKLKAAGVSVGMVQVGNEINNGMSGETDWGKILPMLASGSRAVREVYPEALVAVHFTEPHQKGVLRYYAQLLQDGGLDYDVFASSYYPFWHGTRENLIAVLTEVSQNYGKKVMVMETSWPYTAEDTDFSGNNVTAENAAGADYPFSVQGQADAVRDVAAAVAQVPGGIGICYWEGAWIAVGGSREENSVLWEKYGSGWASSYGGEYDADAKQWYGGSSWDNQAFFDPQGHPLESLRVFRFLRQGNGDQTRQETVPASSGEDGKEPEGVNFLQNGNFETGELEPWELIDRGSGGELFVEEKEVDSLDGKWHMHFWNPGRNCVDFTLQQTVTDLPAGSYTFSIAIMGGDCGETEIYAFVLVDGEQAGTAPMTVTVWNSWEIADISGISVAEGQTVTVGISVKCEGSGNGAWGKIDCASLTPEA